MKYISILLIVWSSQLLAIEPVDICRAYSCTEPMTEINEIFNSLDTALVLSAIGQEVYSGECYFRNPHFDGQRAHHGVIGFERYGSDVHLGGKFKFFSPENPYKDWNLDIVRQKTKIAEATHKVVLKNNYVFADYGNNSTTTPVWWHWFRQDPESLDLYLVALWDVETRVACKLSPNQR